MICSGKLTSRPTKHRDARPSPSQAGPQGAGRGKRRLPADGRTLVSPPHKPTRGALGGASVRLPADERTLVPPSRNKTQKSPIFQRDCWDTQLRRGENYHEKWEYVRNNPVRRGLVANADEWPFGGVLNDLLW